MFSHWFSKIFLTVSPNLPVHQTLLMILIAICTVSVYTLNKGCLHKSWLLSVCTIFLCTSNPPFTKHHHAELNLSLVFCCQSWQKTNTALKILQGAATVYFLLFWLVSKSSKILLWEEMVISTWEKITSH